MRGGPKYPAGTEDGIGDQVLDREFLLTYGSEPQLGLPPGRLWLERPEGCRGSGKIVTESSAAVMRRIGVAPQSSFAAVDPGTTGRPGKKAGVGRRDLISRAVVGHENVGGALRFC